MAAVMRAVVVAVLACAAVVAAHPRPKEIHLRADANPVTGEPMEHIYCGTQEVYEWRQRVLNDTEPLEAAKCRTATCDDPAVRDATSTATVTIRVAFTVINDAINQAKLQASIAAFKARFKHANIDFHVVTEQFVSDTRYGRCIPSYGDSDDWYYAIAALKSTHAYKPEKVLNVFVTCQDPSSQGTLLGIATFPWDKIALTATGGLWMNSVAMDADDDTLAHETGHCLGLWHTFHGTTEQSLCAPSSFVCGKNCCEYPHAGSNTTTAATNDVGDLCSDTLATTMEYLCTKHPSGSACDGTAWTKYGVPYDNYMGYAMVNPNTGKTEHCQDHFTAQQIRRMHCYLGDEIKSFKCSGDSCYV